MKKFCVLKENIGENEIVIDEQEFVHLLKVLRTKVGEQILCFCGDEFEYICEVAKIEKRFAVAKILQKQVSLANPKFEITLFQGLAKGEKLELITQKCTELGLSTLVPFESEFTVAKNVHSREDRLQKITQEACKQCGRTKMVEIAKCIKFDEMINQLKNFELVILAYEHAPEENTCQKLVPQVLQAQKIAIIVGAEGGFSEKENQKMIALKNVYNLNLGKRILRTETAGIALTSFVSFAKNN